MRLVRDDRPIDLGGAWWVAIADEAIEVVQGSAAELTAAGLELRPASVPGSVELDLLRNGLIPEPFEAGNIVELRWVEGKVVYYTRSFDVPGARDPRRAAVIEFEGLDCDAAVYLNGTLVHRSANMLIEHVVPVDEILRYEGENTLCVELSPVVERARSAGFDYPPGLVAEGSGFEGLYVRKAPHMFGWDIMPRAVSAGIWRPVTLRFLPVERVDWVAVETDTPAGAADARLTLRYKVVASGSLGPLEIAVNGSCGPSRFEQRQHLLFEAGVMTVRVPAARYWWPRGRGEPDLYTLEVTLLHDGLPVDTVSFRHGLRTVSLERTSVTTEEGDGEFRFVVNGEAVFVLGTNWVPLDAYHARDAARLPSTLALVEEIGCNMIRCWGGNVYESDAFFDWCDEHGVMVWQDFAMACAIYPQDPAFQEQLRQEAEAVVRRLRGHPSLVLWAGDNECDQKHVRTGSGRDPDRNILTRSVIPEVLRMEDPTRPYLPSSPYIDHVAAAAGERFLPEDHLWGPRDDFKGDYYRGALCHFVSEIGYLGAPDVASLRQFLSPGAVWPYADNAEWLLHATSPLPGIDVHDYRVELLATQIRSLFGSVPDTLEGFVNASQATQAEALKFFIETFRAGKWRRTGIIWWNLADGWPQFSDAVVDYFGRKKRAFDVVRRSQLPVIAVVREPHDGFHEVVVCNDDRDAAVTSVVVRDADTDAILLAATATATGDSVTPIGRIPAEAEHRFLILDSVANGVPTRSHYLAGAPPFSLGRYLKWMASAVR